MVPQELKEIISKRINNGDNNQEDLTKRINIYDSLPKRNKINPFLKQVQTGEKNESYATTSSAKDHGALVFDNPDEKSTNIIRWD